jgi:anti-sigma regulatory factor (Ser/Thr protein kinase)
MMAARLYLSNRPGNYQLLLDFIRKWAKDRGFSAKRRSSLEQVAGEIFQHLVTHAYRPGQPGSIAVSLEEQGPRLRLMFEDDAPPYNPMISNTLPLPEGRAASRSGPLPDGMKQIAESLIYYRTADRKNRLVLFLA